MCVNTNYTNSIYAASSAQSLDSTTFHGDIVMTGGISVLYEFMSLFNDLAAEQYDSMSAQADRARNSQQAANEIDSKMADMTAPDDRQSVPQDVIDYMMAQNISVTVQTDGVTTECNIKDYITQCEGKDHEGEGLTKGELDAVKGALEADSGRCSDFVTQSQLQIQKVMQSYNVCVSLINSMQTLLADMNKAIAQNIR